MGEHRLRKPGESVKKCDEEKRVKKVLRESFHWMLDGNGAIKSVTALRAKTAPELQGEMYGQRLWNFGAEPEDQDSIKASVGDALLTVEDDSFYCRFTCPFQTGMVHLRVVTVVGTSGHELNVFTQTVLDGHESLSAQEAITLTLLGSGYDAKRIAEKMRCTHSTVQTYILRARRKLGIFNFVELVAYCARAFWIP